MRSANEKGVAGGKKGVPDGSEGVELQAAYTAVENLEKSFTAANFSRVPLAFMKAGIKGEIGHRELTANFRGLETAFKPIDAAIAMKRMQKGQDGGVSQTVADQFLGVSQTKPQLAQS